MTCLIVRIPEGLDGWLLQLYSTLPYFLLYYFLEVLAVNVGVIRVALEVAYFLIAFLHDLHWLFDALI
jgi:hypothetical protein